MKISEEILDAIEALPRYHPIVMHDAYEGENMRPEPEGEFVRLSDVFAVVLTLSTSEKPDV